jgi:hypothetical protein
MVLFQEHILEELRYNIRSEISTISGKTPAESEKRLPQFYIGQKGKDFSNFCSISEYLLDFPNVISTTNLLLLPVADC